MNLQKEIERCMDIENVQEIKNEIKKFQEYFNSEEYCKNLTNEQLELITKAKNYKELFNVTLERTEFNIMKGYACSPCNNLIGSSEIRIEKDGEIFYISANFIDEVADVLTLIVNKEKSVWATSFKGQLLPEEDLVGMDAEELLKKYQIEYFISNEEWQKSEFAVLYLVAINMLAEKFLTFDEENEKISADILLLRYFYSRLWYSTLAKKDEFSEIYEIISSY